jgi:hypothetical protein
MTPSGSIGASQISTSKTSIPPVIPTWRERPPKLLVLSDLHEPPEHDDLTSLTYAFASIALLQDQRGTAWQLSGHLKSLRLESLEEERF